MAKKTKKKAKKKSSQKRGSLHGYGSFESIMRRAAKSKRPTRFRYDSDGNVIGFYVPLKHQSKTEQRKATKAMVSACSAGAYRQGVSPSKTCGYRALKPSDKAGRGLAYARWGFPKGWPSRKFSNPAYAVRGLTVKTFKDEDGDWGYAVYSPMGEPLAIGSGEPSEKVAAREGKAEAKFQAEILEIEGRSMRNPKGKTYYTKAKIEKARKLGEAAFKAGKKAVPVHDAKLKALIEPGAPMGSSTELFDAWSYGWHQANLRAPVPNPRTIPLTKGKWDDPSAWKRVPKGDYVIAQEQGDSVLGRFGSDGVYRIIGRFDWDTEAIEKARRHFRGTHAKTAKIWLEKGHGSERRLEAVESLRGFGRTKNPKSTKKATGVRSLVAKALK